MSIVPVFRGRVSDQGHVELLEAERVRRQAFFRTLAGKPIELTVRPARTRRSLDQNAFIHAVPVTILAEHFGYTIPEMKLVLMGECWGWKQIAGHEVPIKPSTAEMSVEDATYFIDWVIPWALTNHGVVIPLPNEVAA